MPLIDDKLDEWIPISVKYKNICDDCKKEITIGEKAFWLRGSRRIRHVPCQQQHSSIQIPPSSDSQPPNKSINRTKPESATTASQSCSTCGFVLNQINRANFCPGCGANLSAALTTTAVAPVNQNSSGPIGNTSISAKLIANPTGPLLDGPDEADPETKTGASISVEDLGRRLEDMTEQILKGMGYSTEKRQRILGKSGTRNEIDILAKKGERVTAVECKNYSRYVGVDELREFKSKLEDLQIGNALFVTNAVFSKDAETYANHHHIRLWNGKQLRENFFSMTIGRVRDASPEIVLSTSLPVNLTLEAFSRLDLANPSALRRQRPRLIFHPYYRYDYRLDIARTDPTRGTHRVTDDGTIIVDALDGEILAKLGVASRLASKFIGSAHIDESAASSKEENQIIEDILTIPAEKDMRMYLRDDCDIIKLQYGVTFRAAQYNVINKVIEDNTKEVGYTIRVARDRVQRKKMPIIPKPYEVNIKRITLVYVPKWSMDIEGENSAYTRKSLAASRTVLVDTISICPKHFSLGKVQLRKKNTHAACDICGSAYCEDHIYHADGRFYCDKHKPEPQTVEGNTLNESKVGSIGKRFGSFLGRNSKS